MIGEASTGAANDLSGATDLAIKMVRDWGLSSRLGPISYGSDRPSYLSAPQLGQERPYAEGTQQIIDQEVSRLLSEAEDRARVLLEDNRLALDAVVAELLERETVSGDELSDIVYRASGARDEEEPDNRPSPNGAHAGAHQLDGYGEPRAQGPVARFSVPKADIQRVRSYGAEESGIGGQ